MKRKPADGEVELSTRASSALQAKGRPRVTFWRLDEIADEMLRAWEDDEAADAAFDAEAESISTVSYEGQA